MRVLVCGGRDFNDYGLVESTLSVINPSVIIHGCARGVDTLAGVFARQNKIPEERYPADWNTHGKAAGPIRNQRMLDEGKPDLVVAFPGGKGTTDMVTRARKAGILVQEIL